MLFVQATLEALMGILLEKGMSVAGRKLSIISILDRLNLAQEPKPDDSFSTYYTHALVRYGINRPPLILRFFALPEVHNAFEEDFHKPDIALLLKKISRVFYESNEALVIQLREKDVSPIPEVEEVHKILDELINRYRSLSDIRTEQALQSALDTIQATNRIQTKKQSALTQWNTLVASVDPQSDKTVITCAKQVRSGITFAGTKYSPSLYVQRPLERNLLAFLEAPPATHSCSYRQREVVKLTYSAALPRSLFHIAPPFCCLVME